MSLAHLLHHALAVRHQWRLRNALLVSLATCGACASIPAERYGVESLQIEGTDAMEPDLIRPCLATQSREHVSLGVTPLRDPGCGQPPFERRGGSVDLFAWPWTTWPVYDATVFQLDLERIERWYRARGFYGARIVDVQYSPPEAAQSGRAPCKDGCPLQIRVKVHEGQPVHIVQSRLKFPRDEIESDLEARARDALQLEAGQRWDEALYAEAKQRVIDVLREAGYAHATVDPDVLIDRDARTAHVTLAVVPGPLTHYGPVRVRSPVSVPDDVILAASGLKEGDLYSLTALDAAQKSVFALGSFATVSIREEKGDEGSTGESIPIVIDVAPRRERDLFLGGGLMGGVLTTGPSADANISVPQWDVHLIARYEDRNFFGGLRRLRIEERPRLLFLGPFPTRPSNSPRFGNLLSLKFEQPGTFEARTTSFVETSWDYGPDPYQLFFRHSYDMAVGLRRAFWLSRLQAELSLHEEIMRVTRRQPLVQQAPSSYRLTYMAESLTLDLRKTTERGTQGGFFKLQSKQAALLWGPGWSFVQVRPEARAYAPLGLGVTLAARFGVGAMYILRASGAFDAEARRLGPQNHRERGGGAQGNRGFAAGRLGDSITGGLRSWLASVELRIPLGKSFSVVGFTDMGDVNAAAAFRWSHLNTAVGGGIRYDTLLGPLRFDVGYRPQALQRSDGSPVTDPFYTDLGFTKFRGAMHLSIGNSF